MTIYRPSLSLLLKSLILLLGIISLTLFAYREAFNNGFTTWDTDGYIIHNPHIQALTWENIKWMFTAFYAANWHPLTWLSHAIDYYFFGFHAWGHHLTSIVIHCLNLVLVFILGVVLLTLIQTPMITVNRFSDAIDNKILLAAGIAALLFGIHPQHVESVAWIAERKDVLCLWFLLMTVLCYIAYVLRNARIWYLFSLGSFILALLSKPMAVTLPVILILLDIYPLHRTSLTTPSRFTPYRRLLLEKLPFFAFTVVSIILTLLAQNSAGAIVNIESFNGLARLLNAFNSLIFYLAKFILPVSLSPLYLLSTSYQLTDYLVLAPVIASLLITVVSSYFWYKRHYAWLITWLFYLVTLSPVIGIIQVGSQAAADRYTYLPTLPLTFFIGMGIATVYYQPNLRRLLKIGIIAGFMVIVSQLIQLTQQYVSIWRSDLTLWTYTVLYNPDNPVAQTNLAQAYFNLGDEDRALVHYGAAASLSLYPKIYIKWLMVLHKQKKYADLIKVYQIVLQFHIDIQQSTDTIYFHLGEAYYHLGEMKKAQEFLQKAVNLNSQNEAAKTLLKQIQAKLH